MTPHFDQTGRLIALEVNGTRYSPDALLRAARDAERLRAVVEAARTYRDTLHRYYRTGAGGDDYTAAELTLYEALRALEATR